MKRTLSDIKRDLLLFVFQEGVDKRIAAEINAALDEAHDLGAYGANLKRAIVNSKVDAAPGVYGPTQFLWSERDRKDYECWGHMGADVEEVQYPAHNED